MTEIEFLEHLKYEVERILGYNAVCAIRVKNELVAKEESHKKEVIIKWFEYDGYVKSVIKLIENRLEELRNA